jgi:surface polysaccharide O-acyltransferase-like enzyme
MQPTSSQRVFYLDLLRLLATVAVIFLHVATSEFSVFPIRTDWYIALIYDSLSRWCVPVFVMISGALFLNQAKTISYRSVFSKYVSRLLIAYLFWTVIYFVWALYFYYGFHISGREDFSVKNVLQAPFNFHLWFLPMLMGVYLLIPILKKVAQDKKLMQYALAIWLVYIIFGFLQFLEVFKMAKYYYPLFNKNDIVGFAGYSLLGYCLSQQSLPKGKRMIVYLLGIIGLAVAIVGTIRLSMGSDEGEERYFAYLSPQVVAMSAALFVMVKECAPKCRKAVLKGVEWVRKDLFGVYLTHVIWLNVFNTETMRHCCSEVITLPLITLIVFLLSLITTKLIRLIPYLRKVVE